MLLLATCCTIAALASPAPGPHPGWEPLADDLPQPVEIDRRRIVREGGVVDVWIRMRGVPDAVAREFEAAGVGDDEVRRVRASLHHSLHLWSFRCDDASHALAVSAYYSADGTLIREFRPTRRAYWPVQPETVGQRLLGITCGRGQGQALADRDDRPDADADDDEAGPGDAASRAVDPAPVRTR
jgi:hypothetical protein